MDGSKIKTFSSPITQQSMAYNQGYRDGYNGTNFPMVDQRYLEQYRKGREDGYRDYVATPTRTGIK